MVSAELLLFVDVEATGVPGPEVLETLFPRALLLELPLPAEFPPLPGDPPPAVADIAETEVLLVKVWVRVHGQLVIVKVVG
jgi:hypothetical protein